MKKPPFPCPFCNGGEFIAATPIALPWVVNNVSTQSNRFVGEALVCTGCGRMELFMKEPAAWAERVAKAPGLGPAPLSVVRAEKPGS